MSGSALSGPTLNAPAKVSIRKVTTTKAACKFFDISMAQDNNEDIPELKEKKRIIQSLMECEERIQQFESCLLSINLGEVSNCKLSILCLFFTPIPWQSIFIVCQQQAN